VNGHDHAVADLELLYAAADFHHLAHELVAEDVAVFIPIMKPSKRCRSEPQIAHEVTLTIASRGSSMMGSGTVS
jgi:hypothetical protein